MGLTTVRVPRSTPESDSRDDLSIIVIAKLCDGNCKGKDHDGRCQFDVERLNIDVSVVLYVKE